MRRLTSTPEIGERGHATPLDSISDIPIEPSLAGTIELQACNHADANVDAKHGEDPCEAEFKQHARDIVELHQQIMDYKVDNILHAAKISRTGEMHINKAKAMASNANAETITIR